jgi:hypothetical protein
MLSPTLESPCPAFEASSFDLSKPLSKSSSAFLTGSF